MIIQDRYLARVFYIVAAVIGVLETGLCYEARKSGVPNDYNPRNLSIALLAVAIGLVIQKRSAIVAWWRRRRG